MTRHHIRSLLACAAMASAPAAMAAEGYDNCTGFIDAVPVVISSQGTWCLRHDVSTAVTEGSAIEIAANNVTIDCNGFKVGGLAAGVATNAAGIETIARNNATVRNCSVRGFRFGIQLSGPGGHLVEDNRVEASTGIGIAVHGGAMVRRNLVIDTGGSPHEGVSVGIFASYYDQEGMADILDNSVHGVVASAGPSGSASVYGIYAMYSAGSINGNRVRGLVPRDLGVAYGIRQQSSDPLIVRDNDLIGSGGTGGAAILCHPSTLAHGNIFLAFPYGIGGCNDYGGNDHVP